MAISEQAIIKPGQDALGAVARAELAELMRREANNSPNSATLNAAATMAQRAIVCQCW